MAARSCEDSGVSEFPLRARAVAAPGNAIVDFQNGARVSRVVLDYGVPQKLVARTVEIGMAPQTKQAVKH